jgi:K+ transporter
VLAILVRPVPILPMLIKILIVATLAAIIASLASGLFHLVRDEGKSNRMVNALTVRITLSVLLFILLFVAWKGGLIQPRGLGR